VAKNAAGTTAVPTIMNEMIPAPRPLPMVMHLLASPVKPMGVDLTIIVEMRDMVLQGRSIS
jgi:hypothetical protein